VRMAPTIASTPLGSSARLRFLSKWTAFSIAFWALF
jgi:hypothetical protein